MRDALRFTGEQTSFVPVKKEVDNEGDNDWILVVLVCALTLAAYAYGIWAIFPSLVRDHQRLEIGWSMLIWIGDLTALLAFAWSAIVAIRHRELPVHRSSPSIGHRWIIAMIFAGLVADLAVTFVVMGVEKKGYERSLPVRGEATQVTYETRYPDEPQLPYREFSFDGSFMDPGTGNTHRSSYRVRAELVDDREEFASNIDERLAAALRDRRGRFSVELRYDPVFPNRAWIASREWSEREGAHGFSMLLSILQLVILVPIVCLSRHEEFSFRQTPQIQQALPLIIQAYLLALIGVYHQMGEIHI